jgi:hypothetical protein
MAAPWGPWITLEAFLEILCSRFGCSTADHPVVPDVVVITPPVNGSAPRPALFDRSSLKQGRLNPHLVERICRRLGVEPDEVYAAHRPRTADATLPD